MHPLNSKSPSRMCGARAHMLRRQQRWIASWPLGRSLTRGHATRIQSHPYILPPVRISTGSSRLGSGRRSPPPLARSSPRRHAPWFAMLSACSTAASGTGCARPQTTVCARAFAPARSGAARRVSAWHVFCGRGGALESPNVDGGFWVFCVGVARDRAGQACHIIELYRMLGCS